MNNELKHYRTPGSKNGVRLYQYKDGRLTELGKKRYLEGEKLGNKHYYEQGYKPGILDYYGNVKKKELNEHIKNVGNKSYKGYERAESKELKRKDPNNWRWETTNKINKDKPAAKRKKQAYWKELEEKQKAIEDRDIREAKAFDNTLLGKGLNSYDALINKVVNDPIDTDLLKVVSQSGSNTNSLLFNISKYIANKKTSPKESSSETYKDTKVSEANAYAKLTYNQLKRFINKFERMYIH